MPTNRASTSGGNSRRVPAPCPKCGKVQSRAYDIERHMLVHLTDEEKTEKYSWCSFPGCDYGTIQLSNLTNHEKRHIGKKDHICDLMMPSSEDPSIMIPCTYRAVDTGGLYHHLKRKHKIDPTSRTRKKPTTPHPQQSSNGPLTRLRSKMAKQNPSKDVFTGSVPQYIQDLTAPSVLGLSTGGHSLSGSSSPNLASPSMSNVDFDTSRYDQPTDHLRPTAESSSSALDPALDPDLMVLPPQNGYLANMNLGYHWNSFNESLPLPNIQVTPPSGADAFRGDGYGLASAFPEMNLFSGPIGDGTLTRTVGSGMDFACLDMAMSQMQLKVPTAPSVFDQYSVASRAPTYNFSGNVFPQDPSFTFATAAQPSTSSASSSTSSGSLPFSQVYSSVPAGIPGLLPPAPTLLDDAAGPSVVSYPLKYNFGF